MKAFLTLHSIVGRPLLAVALLLSLLTLTDSLLAQTGDHDDQPVQIIDGVLDAQQMVSYQLPDLNAGDTLFVYVESLSGNLDPFVGLADSGITLEQVETELTVARQTAAAQGTDRNLAITTVLDTLFLVHDDDGGRGYDAAFQYTLPASASYTLVLSSSYARSTFGGYRLFIGLNAPDVLTGQVAATGQTLAVPGETNPPAGFAIEEVVGTLSPDSGLDVFQLQPFRAGETLYVYAEVTEGDARPRVALQDFVGKSLRFVSVPAEANSITFEYTFPEAVSGMQLFVAPGSAATGSYRLLIGANAPEVLTGTAEPTERRLIAAPTEVLTWLHIDQISGVDQRNENFTVVGSLFLRWNDPRRAFRPDDCECAVQSYFDDDFNLFTHAGDGITWPDYIIFNQQGRRETQFRGAVVASDGTVTYTERFTITLQAPDFDFRLFPFDSQTFFLRINLLLNATQYVFVPDTAQFSLGEQLGEEEWGFRAFDPVVTTDGGVSQLSLQFEAGRNSTYYGFRVLFPITLIIVVTWVTFFIGDFAKRVDVVVANLLVFVTFNFTVSNDLPRLGYLTLLDTVLISTFAVTSLIIVLNVYLQWLRRHDRDQQAAQIDRVAIWAYPLGFFALNALLIISYVVVIN